MARKKNGHLCRSVGAIIKNGRGHYLVVYRKELPKGIAFPAGHIEPGEGAKDALVRELSEETNLKAKRVYYCLRAIITGICKRGARKHAWHVFRVIKYSGRPIRMERDKHSYVKFMSPRKIAWHIKRGKADPSWVEIFRRLKIINGRH